MRDTQRPLRMAIHNVLTGNVFYGGSAINFYDEKKKAGQSDKVYGIYSTQQTTRDQQSVDETWITSERIDLEFTHQSGFEVTKDFIDDLTDQAYQILLPSRLNDSLPDPLLMRIEHFELEQALTRSVEITSTETIVSKIVTFSCKIIQQQ